jgi:hypothetical protein
MVSVGKYTIEAWVDGIHTRQLRVAHHLRQEEGGRQELANRLPEIGGASKCRGTTGVVAMMLSWSNSSCTRAIFMILKEISNRKERRDGRDIAEFIQG